MEIGYAPHLFINHLTKRHDNKNRIQSLRAQPPVLYGRVAISLGIIQLAFGWNGMPDPSIA